MLLACKKCRREGEKLSLKGERCLSTKCAMNKRPYAPGDHGQGFHGKMSEYGKQLREKQKAKKIYNISESHLRKYATEAERIPGIKTENIMRLIETRIDNIVYRLGFAVSRSSARQMVSHGGFKVNGQRVTISSYQLKIADVIEPMRPARFKDLSLNPSITWLEADTKKLSGKVKHFPVRDEIDTPVNENLIIEFYSR